MTTVVLTGLVTGSLGAVLGYFVRVLQERHLEARRERALSALSGELPDWEKRARALEDQADEDEINSYPSVAQAKRDKASIIRRVARQSLRQRRRWLP